MAPVGDAVRILASLLSLLWSSVAMANAYPCPSITAGWSIQNPGPLTSATYDETSLLFYTIWYYTIPSAFYPVPTSVMQVMSSASDPSQTYYSYLLPSYGVLLLKEVDNCPVLQENGGYIWNEQPPPAYLTIDGQDFLGLSSGEALWIK